MTTTQLEKRLAAVEADIARLKKSAASKNQWWNQIAGAFADNPRFDQAMRLARQHPDATKPSKARRKSRQ